MKFQKDRMLDHSDYAIIFAVLSIILFCAWTYTYDAATPAGTDPISSIDDRIREFKNAIQERNNIDHYWPLTGTQVSDADAGKHRQITFQAVLSADPTVSSGQGQLYIKTVGSQEELFFRDDTNSALQITSAGTLNITSADLLGTLANNTYFTAKDAAGTSTVNLIKADSNDVAVIPNDSQTATNAAPTQTKALVNKKYVDDLKIVPAKVTNIFGEWVSKSENTVYQADKDGFVVLMVIGNMTAANYVQILTDSSNPPTTVRQQLQSSYFSDKISIMCPVRKDDYYKIVTSLTYATVTIYWLPIGS